jgi:hypothetical protein
MVHYIVFSKIRANVCTTNYNTLIRTYVKRVVDDDEANISIHNKTNCGDYFRHDQVKMAEYHL